MIAGNLTTLLLDSLTLDSLDSVAAISLIVQQDGLEELSGHFIDLASFFTPSDDAVHLSMCQFRSILLCRFFKNGPCKIET